MSDDQTLVIHLYWGGKIVYAGGSMLYDPPMPNKLMFLRERVGYAELMDKIYNIMNLDRNRFKISLLFRNCLQQNGVFGAMPLVDDDGVDAIYYLKGNIREATELYVEVEDVPELEEHYNQVSQLDQGTSQCAPVQMDVARTDDFYGSQVPELECGDVQPTRRRRRRGIRGRVDVHPSSSQVDIHTTFEEEFRGEQNDEFTVRLPSGEADIEFVAADSDSEPEPEDEESDDDVGTTAQGVTTPQDVGPSARWTNYDTPTLQYDAGVDATLQFDPLSGGGVEKLNVWNERSKELRLEQLFDSKEDVQRAVKLWSIKELREYKVRESTPTTWYVRCKARNSTPPCNWQLRATLRSSHNMWMIVTLADEHTCVRVSNRNDHRQLSGDIIAEHIIPHIINGPLFKVKEIQTSVKQEFHCDVSYKKAWYARRRAIDIVYGDWPSAISLLPTYMEELQRSNPGTVVVWDPHPTSTPSNVIFDYVFWAFAPAIQAFRHMKPVICVDGTFLKGPYKGKLLAAVGYDACNHLLPLAFALVDEENNRSWCWFMTLLRVHVCGNIRNICIISDRHKAIIHAMTTLPEWREPLGIHRFCLVHVQSNFAQKFRNER